MAAMGFPTVVLLLYMFFKQQIITEKRWLWMLIMTVSVMSEPLLLRPFFFLFIVSGFIYFFYKISITQTTNSMKNILITGGAGFIGSNLTVKLVSKGYNITILDNLSKQIHAENQDSALYNSIKDKATFILGDICNKLDWEKALEGQDAVIHLAAETGTGQSMYEITRYSEVNIIGTAHLLNILANKKHTISKILIASSRSIYGEGKYLCDNHGVIYPNRKRCC